MTWDARYTSGDYLFGKEPSQFLVRYAQYLKAGITALSVADGEGRNGVWLAEQGLDVHAIDLSSVALEKGALLAAERGVSVHFEQCDVVNWQWPIEAYDIVVAIFTQFAAPSERDNIFAGMKQAVKHGGLILLHGYTPKQIDYRTGGPSQVENLYTEDLLRHSFAGFEIKYLRSYDAKIAEGTGHVGQSALIDFIACKG